MQTKVRATVLTLLVLLATTAFAASGGAGGLLFGIQRPDLAPGFLPAADAGIPGVEHIGGFGYGVDRAGFIVGGFGFAFLDQGLLGDTSAPVSSLAGGIGGMIIGQRVIDSSRVYLDLSLRLGVGGAALAPDGIAWNGWAVAYAEPYAELTVAVTRWMALSAQAGYRFIGNFAPGAAFADLFLRSPALSFTVQWGRYR